MGFRRLGFSDCAYRDDFSALGVPSGGASRASKMFLGVFGVVTLIASIAPDARADGRPHARRPRAGSSAQSSSASTSATVPTSPPAPTSNQTPLRPSPRQLPEAPRELGSQSALAGAFFPPILPADPDQTPPPGYRLESQKNDLFFWGGVVIFGAGYGAGIAYGAANGFNEGLGLVAVPLVGPFLAIGQRQLTCSVSTITPSSDPAAELNACQRKLVNEATTIATLSAVGAIQIFGGGLALLGLLDRRHTWVRTDLGSAELKWSPRLLPGGVAFDGTF